MRSCCASEAAYWPTNALHYERLQPADPLHAAQGFLHACLRRPTSSPITTWSSQNAAACWEIGSNFLPRAASH